jgi:4,5-dihydroxyphthalate decarboxylase
MIELSIALTANINTRPVVEGRIRAEGIRLIPSVMSASEMFYRQLKFAEFDVSEMSLSSLLIAFARGDTRWTAIPIYTMRRFFHTWTLVRGDRGIEAPRDLRGKRVGVPEYQQTAAIWARGILLHEFGVRPDEIEWFMERTAETSHGGATGFVPPNGIRISFIPASTNIGEMLVKGELDATLLYLRQTNIVDRSSIDLETVPEVRPLFADVEAESRRFYAKTGLFPINHAMVVRRSIAEQHPWIAANLVKAFAAARADAVRTATDVLNSYVLTGRVDPAIPAAFRNDPMTYGIKESRRELETVADWVFEQGLCPRRVSLEEIFAPSMFDI